MIRLPIDHYGYGKGRGFCVELESEYRTVSFTLDGEQKDEDDRSVELTSAEARELAAMLVHYANEAERPR